MNDSRSNWKLTAAIVLCLLAAGVIVYMKNRPVAEVKDTPPQVTQSRRTESPDAGKSGVLTNAANDEPEPQEEEPKPDPTIAKLEALNAAGNIAGIEAELKNIAAAGELLKVEELLTGWCQTGSPALVRTCLDATKTADPKLHLFLKVETIANSSEEIRNATMGEIEKSTGIRFTDVRHARLWARSQFKE